MRHHNAPRFGKLLHTTRATLDDHRAGRERICAELALIRSGPEADDFVSAVVAAVDGGGGEKEAARGGKRRKGPKEGGLVRWNTLSSLTRRLGKSTRSKPAAPLQSVTI